MLSFSKEVPVLTADIREGKNDINAHVDFFRVGLDLSTESPSPLIFGAGQSGFWANCVGSRTRGAAIVCGAVMGTILMRWRSEALNQS